MVDLNPHPLVTSLAQGLVDRGVQPLTAAVVAAGEAGPLRPVVAAEEAEPAALATGLATAPDLPELVAFAGFLGAPVARGEEIWQLLYLDWRLLSWLLVLRDRIYHRDRITDPTAPSGRRDVIWVDSRASVSRGSGPQSIEERFLRGDFTRAGDFRASLTGGTFSAATGIFCEASTPQCCGRQTRG